MWPFKPKTTTPKEQKSIKGLKESALFLIQRDYALSESNNDYDRQLLELNVLQEILMMANQLKDRQQMFQQVGELLRTHMNYDRFFIIEEAGTGYKPLLALGFEDKPFEGMFQHMQTSSTLPALFKDQPFWLFKPSQDPFTNQVISILNVSSAAIVQLRTPSFKALLGVAIDQPIDSLMQRDLNFLLLLSNQLNVIVNNIEQFNALTVENQELRRLDKAKTTFLSIASHQLRTPLSVMRYALAFLTRPQTGQLNPKQLQLVTEMKNSNVRIINLVNNLLNITRMEQGRLQVSFSTVNLAEMIRLILQEQQTKIIEKQVHVVTDVPEIITLQADPMLIREAIMNLISNGVKYNKQGGQLSISCRSTGDKVMITVADTGIGISKDDQNHLFTQFFRSQEAQSIDPEGVGLGLYTTLQFIKLHGGDVTISSLPGKGTTFTVYLPIRQGVATV